MKIRKMFMLEKTKPGEAPMFSTTKNEKSSFLRNFFYQIQFFY